MVIRYIFNRKTIALVNNSEQVPLVGDEVLITPECFPYYKKDVREDKLYIVKQRRFIPQCQEGEVICIILDDTNRKLDILDEVKNEEYEQHDGIINDNYNCE